MRVCDLMTSDVWTCRPEDDLAVVGTIMARVACGALPVADADGEVIGILTDRDVCLCLAQRDRRPSEVIAAEVMRREVFSCQASDDICAAMAAMRRHRVRRLPVLDTGGRLVGILSLDDIAAEARAVAAERFGAPAYSDVAQTLRAVSRAHPHDREMA